MNIIKTLFFLLLFFYSVELLAENIDDGPRSMSDIYIEGSGYVFKQRDLEKIIGWVRSADAEIDAYTSISKKDFRFIGYISPIGDRPITPGNNACLFPNYSSIKIRTIDGPHPARPGERAEGQDELVALFDEYLDRYNYIIKDYLIEIMGLRCHS